MNKIIFNCSTPATWAHITTRNRLGEYYTAMVRDADLARFSTPESAVTVSLLYRLNISAPPKVICCAGSISAVWQVGGRPIEIVMRPQLCEWIKPPTKSRKRKRVLGKTPIGRLGKCKTSRVGTRVKKVLETHQSARIKARVEEIRVRKEIDRATWECAESLIELYTA